MKLEDVQTSDYEIGLTKMVGKKVKEVHGYLSEEFDDVTFKLTKIEFDDGTFVGCEGEHDFPYLVNWRKDTVLDEDVMADLYQQENG